MAKSCWDILRPNQRIDQSCHHLSHVASMAYNCFAKCRWSFRKLSLSDCRYYSGSRVKQLRTVGSQKWHSVRSPNIRLHLGRRRSTKQRKPLQNKPSRLIQTAFEPIVIQKIELQYLIFWINSKELRLTVYFSFDCRFSSRCHHSLCSLGHCAVLRTSDNKKVERCLACVLNKLSLILTWMHIKLLHVKGTAHPNVSLSPHPHDDGKSKKVL